MLDRAGASVLAIEANKLSFLRCLIAKDLLRLDYAHFLLGNFVRWLEATEERYDIIVACGVLYHMSDPVHLLETMARRTDCVFLWTHYFDATAMPPNDLRHVPFSGEVIARDFRGIPVRLHTRHYYGAQQDAAFCGGPNDRHYWLEWIVDGYYVAPGLIDGDTLDRTWAAYENAIRAGTVTPPPDGQSDAHLNPGRALDPHMGVPEIPPCSIIPRCCGWRICSSDAARCRSRPSWVTKARARRRIPTRST